MRRLLCVLLLAWASPALASLPRWYEEPPRIASVELRLSRMEDAELAAELVPLRSGQYFSRQALRRTVRLLYETGRFEQIEAYLRQTPEGVVVSLVGKPRLRLAEVVFSGNESLSEQELMRASGLVRGKPYRPGKVEAARGLISELYGRHGFDSPEVTVETRTSEGGLVACAIRIREGPRSRLGRIDFVGRLGLPPPLLTSAMELERGAFLVRDQIDQGLDRVETLLRQAGYLRTRVGPISVRPDPGEAGPFKALEVRVDAGPRTRIEVRGAARFTAAELEELAGLAGGRPLDPASLAEGVARIEARYRRLGYAEVRVGATEEPVGRGRTLLVIEVEEGERLVVEGIDFPGAHARDPQQLSKAVCAAVAEVLEVEPQVVQEPVVDALVAGPRDRSAGEARPQRRRPDPCTVWEPEVYTRALAQIRDAYRRDGFLGAQVSEPELVRDGDGRHARVVVQVAEGPRTRIAELRLVGVDEDDLEAIREVVTVEQGAPLSLLAIEASREGMEARYRELGHPFVRVRQEVALDTTRLMARVVFEAEPGPQVRVGRVIVRGHRHTSTGLIRSRLTFGQGDLWSSASVRRSQQQLMELGNYRSAAIRLLEPEAPAEEMDVVVVVSEKRPRSVELGLGVSTEDGPRAFADYDDLSFLGGSALEVRTKANYPVFQSANRIFAPGPEWEARFGLRFPRLSGLRTDAAFEHDVRPTYTLTRMGTSVGAGTRVFENWTPSIRAELEFDDLDKGRLVTAEDVILTQEDRERLRLEQGQTLLVSVRPGLTVDLRDDPFTPTRGALISANLDWSHDLGVGVPIHFLRTSAAASWYLPAGEGITLALSGRAGRVFPLSRDNNTIGPKRFFLGGADNLRGFPVDSVFPEDARSELRDQVADCQSLLGQPTLCTDDALAIVQGKRPTSTGGEAFVLLKTELRFPIAGALRGGVFVDLGNIWQDPRALDLRRLRPSAGAGLRYDTPVGPMALDLGVNLLPDPVLREEALALHFAIGLF
ncbi:MAG: POTRA domain-containing protein [Deltaproteobacteria bacterium]|nr:POTRA domain-containing protein [Deltaproteobacteria bacterium]